MGLLLPHKRTTVSIFPDMVSVSVNQKNHTGGGKRDVISSFSPESRYRLFRLLHSIRFDRVSFVTLTYGATFPPSGRIAKVDLKAYRRSFERRYGKVPAVWRMEFQRREAVHFHLMYFDPPFIPIADWNDLWDSARHAPSAERFGNSVDLRWNSERQDSRRIGYYIAKYVGKTDDRSSDEVYKDCGRIWGKWNIEEPEPITLEVSQLEADRLSKLLLYPQEADGRTPFDRERYTVFGAQMGSDAFGTSILEEIRLLFKYTRRVEQKIEVSYT